MARCFSTLFILAAICVSASPAQAQWFENMKAKTHTAYKRNVAWPEPFLLADRQSTNLPLGLQVANGWRRQNLLSDYHFNEDNPQLNQAGELRLHFILTQMPPQRRTIYVQRSMSPDVTAMRMAVVQRAAMRMAPGGMADIVESDLMNDGWPADEINSVASRFNATRPDPRLKASSQGGANGQGSQ